MLLLNLLLLRRLLLRLLRLGWFLGPLGLLWLLLLGLLLRCLTAATLRDDGRGSGRRILCAGDRRWLALRRRGALPRGGGRLCPRTLRQGTGYLTGSCRRGGGANDQVGTEDF